MFIDKDGNQHFESLDDIRAYFRGDKFATECLGATVDDFDWDAGTARVSMTVEARHYNGQGFVMGGVFFSICDFALAIACNVGQPPSTSVDHFIQCMNRLKGTRLIATAIPVKCGRTLGFFRVELTDELGTNIAHMTATIMRSSH